MTSRDFDQWAEASLTHNRKLAATLPTPAPANLPVAAGIADQITDSARTSGDDPIAWVTGNSMMPPLRSFDAAEDVWQHAANDDGEAFAYLVEEIERLLSDANVALKCPEYDNALYAVDLARFEYTETPDGDMLQDDWAPVTPETPER